MSLKNNALEACCVYYLVVGLSRVSGLNPRVSVCFEFETFENFRVDLVKNPEPEYPRFSNISVFGENSFIEAKITYQAFLVAVLFD